MKQWKQRRIAGIATIPEHLHRACLRVFHLDRLEQRRQTGRGQDALRADPVTLENPHLAVAHIGGADIKLRPLHRADPVEIELRDDLFQRVVVKRPPGIGRQHPAQRVAQHVDRRQLDGFAHHPRRRQPGLHPFRHRQIIEPGHLRPEPVEALPRTLALTTQPARLERRAIQRPGRGAGDRRHLDIVLVQQPVQHTPGKRAMCATALQRQIDLHHRATRSFILPSKLRGARGAGPSHRATGPNLRARSSRHPPRSSSR